MKGKKYCKVKDHWHHTGEYRGGAYLICNLKLSGSKKSSCPEHLWTTASVPVNSSRILRRSLQGSLLCGSKPMNVYCFKLLRLKDLWKITVLIIDFTIGHCLVKWSFTSQTPVICFLISKSPVTGMQVTVTAYMDVFKSRSFFVVYEHFLIIIVSLWRSRIKEMHTSVKSLSILVWHQSKSNIHLILSYSSTFWKSSKTW